ncbi:unnamed protein product [Paramecium sonneborni]|uniref:Uncharacterized protein n=1 Tax=Paramecium sonneborni TaxID=65129 RepID=A0A8S1R0M8_9CILI|nr:unnamed protein product [Paramecium sonneborni]
MFDTAKKKTQKKKNRTDAKFEAQLFFTIMENIQSATTISFINKNLFFRDYPKSSKDTTMILLLIQFFLEYQFFDYHMIQKRSNG